MPNSNKEDPFLVYAPIARLVIWFWLAGWYIKIGFYAPYLLATTRQFPIVHPMSPLVFQSPDTANFFYFLPAIIVPLLLLRREFYLKLAVYVMLFSSVVLNLHINTCNDATFVTSFWVALWLLWFVSHYRREGKDFRWHAKVIGLCIIGMIFLGGFVGKLTPEYWSGQVMAQILFAGGLKAPLGQMILSMSENDRQLVMTFLSRFVIIFEGVLVLTPILPIRFVFGAMCCILLGFSLFSTWMIFSVLLCLLGMIVAILLLEKIDGQG